MVGGAVLRGEESVRAAYAAHGPELYRLALRSLHDHGGAEEAVQETFLRAWRRAGDFEPDRASLRTWLFAIGRNVIVDTMRRRAVRPLTGGGEAVDGPAPGADPIETAMNSWQVEEALRRLSDDHRRAIVETYYRQRPYAEVAAELGVPEGTVRSRVYYGLRALRLALEELGWHEYG